MRLVAYIFIIIIPRCLFKSRKRVLQLLLLLDRTEPAITTKQKQQNLVKYVATRSVSIPTDRQSPDRQSPDRTVCNNK